MSRKIFTSILLTLLSLCVYLPAQETISPPEPASLKSNWWKYYQTTEDKLDERAKSSKSSLDAVLKNLSEENRVDAQEKINAFLANLQAYVQIVKQPPPQAPAPKPIAESYTLEEVLRINQNIHQITFKMNSTVQTRELTLEKREENLDHLDELRKKYADTGDRTEEKILIGLEMMVTRSAIETADKKIEYLNRLVESQKELIEQNKEELDIALDRLQFNPDVVPSIATRIEELNKALQKIRKEKALTSTDQTSSPVEKTDPLSQSRKQLAELENIKLATQAALIHTQLISFEAQKAIAELSLNGDPINMPELQNNIATWNRILSEYQTSLELWPVQAKKRLQTSMQLMSLNKEVPQELTTIQNDILNQENEIQFDLQLLRSQIKEAEFLLVELEKNASKKFSGGKKWFYHSVNFIKETGSQALDLFDQTLFRVGNNPVNFYSVLKFLFIILLTLLVSKLASRSLYTLFTKKQRGLRKSDLYRINRLMHYVILTIGFFIAASFLSFDLSSFALIVGALGVGLGFGLQSIFNNFVSGIIILFESYLRVGDFIELDNGLRGEIKAINFRSILIRTNDGVDILLPNSEFINNRVVNWTLNDPNRRIHIPFNVAYGTDKELVKNIVEKGAENIEYTLDRVSTPPPEVRFVKFGDSSLEFELAVWVNDKASRKSRKANSAYLWMIDTVLRKNDITVPFPQRDVHMIEEK